MTKKPLLTAFLATTLAVGIGGIADAGTNTRVRDYRSPAAKAKSSILVRGGVHLNLHRNGFAYGRPLTPKPIPGYYIEDSAPAPAKRGKAKRNAKRHAKMMERFDKNGDGVLSARERRAMKAAKAKRKARVMKRFDVNGDGFLSPAEKRQMRAKKQARKARMMERFDVNGDGTLSPAERETMKEARQNRRAKRLKRFDTNGDGVLSPAEKSRMKEIRENRRERRMKFDTNRDGTLSPAEKARMKAERRKAKWRSLDSNQNGILTAAEVNNHRLGKGKSTISRAQHLATFDLNRDGQVRQWEWNQALDAKRAAKKANRS